uniref:Uncharacterized protein n=1 Tax=Anas platyrhynchos platyrhynchos TaxID=8840 RepID=A0A493SU64_ANAPP
MGRTWGRRGWGWKGRDPGGTGGGGGGTQGGSLGGGHQGRTQPQGTEFIRGQPPVTPPWLTSLGGGSDHVRGGPGAAAGAAAAAAPGPGAAGGADGGAAGPHRHPHRRAPAHLRLQLLPVCPLPGELGPWETLVAKLGGSWRGADPPPRPPPQPAVRLYIPSPRSPSPSGLGAQPECGAEDVLPDVFSMLPHFADLSTFMIQQVIKFAKEIPAFRSGEGAQGGFLGVPPIPKPGGAVPPPPPPPATGVCPSTTRSRCSKG